MKLTLIIKLVVRDMRRIFHPFFVISIFILISFLMFSGLEESISTFFQTKPNQSNFVFAIVGFAALSADCILPIPSSIVIFAMGWRMDFVTGSTISILACLLSSVLAYRLGKMAKQKVDRAYTTEETRKAQVFIEKYGDYSIVLSRGIPILSESISIIAGNNSMHFNRFFWANLIGYIPICMAYAYLGSISSSKDIFLWTFSINVLIAGILWAVKNRV